MSLKAKIEAVIYAAEEPVTLAQLVSLLGQEAQAELDARAAQQNEQESLPLEENAEAGDPDTLNAETLDERAGIETPTTDVSSRPEPSPGDDAVERPASEASADNAKTDADARTRERHLREHFRTLLDELIADYATSDRGIEIREVAGGFRLATKPEYHDAVRGFVKSLKPPLKLSLQALETLAVIAYKQPVTAPEVSEIRGVDSSGVLGSLMGRKLIVTAGRKQVIGRPILYKTTKEFLLRFGLKDLSELPSIEEFEKMAGEFADAAQEEMPMPPGDENRRSEEDPADEVLTDGRISGLPPNYDRDDFVEGDAVDSPELDAQVQGEEENKGA